MLESADTNSVILFCTLSREDIRLIQQNEYDLPIRAFEYAELALEDSNIQTLVKISYNTENVLDTDTADTDKIKALLQNYTGIRLKYVDTKQKCFRCNKCTYSKARLLYILNPKTIDILDTRDIIR